MYLAAMSLSLKEVQKVAKLSRIRFSDEEAAKYQKSLNRIFGWIDELQEVDTKGVEPLYNVHDAHCSLFEDVVAESDQSKEVLANSPVEPVQNFYRVPKVVE